MEVIGIVGSPREGGNTDILVERILDGVRSRDKNALTEKIILNQLNLNPCQACFDINDEKMICNTEDDMEELYTKLEFADGIIWGSPIYYGGVTAQMKTFIDRLYGYHGWDFRRKLKPGKCGIVVVTWADPRGSILEINYFVTDILKSIMQQLGIEVVNEITVRGVGEKGKINELGQFKITEKTIEKVEEKIDKDKLARLVEKEFSREALIEKLKEIELQPDEIDLILNHTHMSNDILDTAFRQGVELVDILQMPYVSRVFADPK